MISVALRYFRLELQFPMIPIRSSVSPLFLILVSLSVGLAGLSPGAALAESKPLVLVSASYGKNVIALCELDGRVIWKLATRGPEKGHAGHHEIQMLDNGNILFHDDWTTVKEIKLDGSVVWQYTGDGVHAFSRLDDGRTMIAESGKDRIILVSPKGEVLQETPLGKGGLGKTRQAEVLDNGNYLVCAEGPGTVTEYAPNGEIVWQYKIGTRVYGAIRLSNGNTLINSGSGHSIMEVSPAKEVVREIKDRVPGIEPGKQIELQWTACLKELPNGHVMIDNCHAGPDNPQLFELDSERNVVWQFNEFDLVGNGMACFDYVDGELAEQVRKQVAAE